MRADYVKFSGNSFEAQGRCALPAFYAVVVFRLVGLGVVTVMAITAGPSVLTKVADVIARHLI